MARDFPKLIAYTDLRSSGYICKTKQKKIPMKINNTMNKNKSML